MKTIADRLNAVKQVKEDIKTAIEKKGVDMEGVPFTEYAGKVEGLGPKEIIPLEVTENGTYTAKEGEAFNPVTVNIERSIKKYLEAGGSFSGNVEDLRNVLEYNDTENCTDYYGLFSGMRKLKYVPLLNTKKGTSMNYLFNNCEVLIEVPNFDFSSCTIMQYAFAACKTLTEIPSLDVRNVFSFSGAFNLCTNLTEIWVKNINAALTVGSGSSYGHLLKVECLIHLIYELRYRTATRTLTMGNVNLEKLANVYVRLVEITDGMRAEDDLIDEKLPFEVCESTDEGAIQIVEYAKLKNWNIA